MIVGQGLDLLDRIAIYGVITVGPHLPPLYINLHLVLDIVFQSALLHGFYHLFRHLVMFAPFIMNRPDNVFLGLGIDQMHMHFIFLAIAVRPADRLPKLFELV